MGSEEAGAGRKIMLLAILSLFLIVILIVILQLYTKFYMSRLHRRRWQVDAEYNSGQPQSGLDPSVIAALPAFRYHGGDEAMECAVCLGAVVEGATVRALPNCKHLFHAECVDMWLSSHTSCPICRAGVQAVIGPAGAGEMGRGSVSEAQQSAPPLDREIVGGAQLEKGGVSSSSRLDSFRRIFVRGSGGGNEIGTDQDVERL